MTVLRDAAPLHRDEAPAALTRAERRPVELFASVTVFGDLGSAEAAWRALQRIAPASPYQTLAWAEACATADRAASDAVLAIGVAFARNGRPVALLPLQVTRVGPVAVARFLGGSASNYQFGLFDPAIGWTAPELQRLLRAIAARAPRRPHVFALTNQPHAWDGRSNPMRLLPTQPSPSQAHATALRPDGEALLQERFSAAARKKLRSKANQLAALGPVTHQVARDPATLDAILAAQLAQKAAKLALAGASTDLEAARTLFAQAARPRDDGPPLLEAHALTCGERIVATFCGLAHAGRFSGVSISHDPDPVFARLSPGEQLLTQVVRTKCAEGFTSFDLGIGEARYKDTLCPVEDALFDQLIATSLRGRLYVMREAARLRAKRRIKQSPWAWPLVVKARRLRGRLRRAVGQAPTG